jgi:glycosyltransferase involved in cell wall biosynthesis
LGVQSEKEKRLMTCVVIPSYNAEGFILRAVDSAFISGTNCAIVVNDGSTDGTLAMLQGHARFQDELIVVSQTNKGESAAVNAGVDYICKRFSSKIEAKSSPVYLCVLSADDFLHENSLEHLRCALEGDRDAVAAYPNWNWVNSAEEVLKFVSPEKYDKVSLLGKLRCLPGPGTLMRISAINGLNGPLRNENVTFIGDLDQWVRLSRLGRFLKVPVPGASWTDHELNQTKLIDGELLSRGLSTSKNFSCRGADTLALERGRGAF